MQKHMYGNNLKKLVCISLFWPIKETIAIGFYYNWPKLSVRFMQFRKL